MTSRKVYRKARRDKWRVTGGRAVNCMMHTRILKEAMMANNALCWKLCGNCANDSDSGLCTPQQARPQSRRLARTPMACCGVRTIQEGPILLARKKHAIQGHRADRPTVGCFPRP